MHTDFSIFRDFPITDSHEHIESRVDVRKTIESYRAIFSFFGYDRILLLACHDLLDRPVDPTCSLKCLFVKMALSPKLYAFAGLQHTYDERDTAEEYLRQIRSAWEMGFDGFKMLEGKPGLRVKTGQALSGEIYEPMFAYAEQKQIPITLHATDPAYFWDPPEEEKENMRKLGWLIEPGWPSRHEIFTEIDTVMQRHPRLRLVIAHLMCDNEDVREATRFLESYPNTGYDLTACESEYTIASRAPEAWREFFLRFADRLYFGTDMDNPSPDEESIRRTWGYTSNCLSRTYLESMEDFERHGVRYRSLRLPDDVIRKIYHDNFVTRLNERPRRVDVQAFRDACQKLLENMEEDAAESDHVKLDRINLRYMIDRIS